MTASGIRRLVLPPGMRGVARRLSPPESVTFRSQTYGD